MAELVPIEHIREYLQIVVHGDADIEMVSLGMIADHVGARFDTYVGYEILTHSVTEIKDSDGREIFLNEKPVQAITSLKFSYNYDWDNEPEIDASAYYLDANNAIIYMRDYAPSVAHNHIRVAYTAGYEQDDIPTSIIRAYLAQVRHEWSNKNQFGHTQITNNDGGSVDVVGFNLLPDVKNTLDQYRRLV